MSELICEVCGSTDVYETGSGLFHCRKCDCDYTSEQITKKYTIIDFSSLNVPDVGEYFTFGSYYQGSSNKTPVEWLVLEKTGNSALIISKESLCIGAVNSTYSETVWENCLLRKWLNDEFFYEAFDPAEQQHIAVSVVSADNNPEYSTDPGNETNDKIFLLSIAEAEKYFVSDESRMCTPVDYLSICGNVRFKDFRAGGKDDSWWWLRSPGANPCSVACIIKYGSFNYYGEDADDIRGMVRPAMWIMI